MTTLRNTARDRLAQGQIAAGLGLRQARTVDIAKAAKTCGYDWLFLDLEHNSMDLDTAVQISVAALDAGIAPFVRVPAMQTTLATRALDGGAIGVVMPHVDTPEEAREIVDKLKYPPIGHRSIVGAQPHYDFRPINVGEATRELNAIVMVVVMLETPKAIENADKIAAVPGVDSLLIGTSDLTLELGIPGKFDDPQVEKAYRTMIAACKKHGKWAGMGGIYSPPMMKKYIDMGCRLLLGGSDLSFMMDAASARVKFLRELV
jgi:2-keto-3-deoxy-L-rhamnonate aldolase RhmA